MSERSDMLEAENKTYWLKAGDRKPVLELELYDSDGDRNQLLVGSNAMATVSGSPNLTRTGLTLTGLAIGQHVVGTGIPTGTTVQSFTDDTIVMTANATISASGGASPIVDIMYPSKLVVTAAVGGRRLVDAVAMSPSGVTGARTVSYTWAGTELVAGDYLMEVIANHGLATQESFPRGSYYKLTIVPHL